MREVLKIKSKPEANTIHSFGWKIQGSKRITGGVLDTSGKKSKDWKNRETVDPYYVQFTSGINADDFPEIYKIYPNRTLGEKSFKQKLKDGVSAWKKELL